MAEAKVSIEISAELVREFVTAFKGAQRSLEEVNKILKTLSATSAKTSSAMTTHLRRTADETHKLSKAFTDSWHQVKKFAFEVKSAIFVIVGLTVFFKKAVPALYDFNMQLEMQLGTLKAFQGSTRVAQQTLAFLVSYAAKTPFEIPGVIAAGTTLAKFGLEVEKNMPLISAMAVVGKRAGETMDAALERMSIAFSKAAKGAYGALKILRDSLGLTRKDLEALGVEFTKAGTIIPETLVPALHKWAEMTGAMKMVDEWTWKLSTAWANLKDIIVIVSGLIGYPLFQPTKEGLLAIIGLIKAIPVEVFHLLGASIRALILPLELTLKAAVSLVDIFFKTGDVTKAVGKETSLVVTALGTFATSIGITTIAGGFLLKKIVGLGSALIDASITVKGAEIWTKRLGNAWLTVGPKVAKAGEALFSFATGPIPIVMAAAWALSSTIIAVWNEINRRTSAAVKQEVENLVVYAKAWRVARELTKEAKDLTEAEKALAEAEKAEAWSLEILKKAKEDSAKATKTVTIYDKKHGETVSYTTEQVKAGAISVEAATRTWEKSKIATEKARKALEEMKKLNIPAVTEETKGAIDELAKSLAIGTEKKGKFILAGKGAHDILAKNQIQLTGYTKEMYESGKVVIFTKDQWEKWMRDAKKVPETIDLSSASLGKFDRAGFRVTQTTKGLVIAVYEGRELTDLLTESVKFSEKALKDFSRAEIKAGKEAERVARERAIIEGKKAKEAERAAREKAIMEEKVAKMIEKLQKERIKGIEDVYVKELLMIEIEHEARERYIRTYIKNEKEKNKLLIESEKVRTDKAAKLEKTLSLEVETNIRKREKILAELIPDAEERNRRLIEIEIGAIDRELEARKRQISHLETLNTRGVQRRIESLVAEGEVLKAQRAKLARDLERIAEDEVAKILAQQFELLKEELRLGKINETEFRERARAMILETEKRCEGIMLSESSLAKLLDALWKETEGTFKSHQKERSEIRREFQRREESDYLKFLSFLEKSDTISLEQRLQLEKAFYTERLAEIEKGIDKGLLAELKAGDVATAALDENTKEKIKLWLEASDKIKEINWRAQEESLKAWETFSNYFHKYLEGLMMGTAKLGEFLEGIWKGIAATAAKAMIDGLREVFEPLTALFEELGREIGTRLTKILRPFLDPLMDIIESMIRTILGMPARVPPIAAPAVPWMGLFGFPAIAAPPIAAPPWQNLLANWSDFGKQVQLGAAATGKSSGLAGIAAGFSKTIAGFLKRTAVKLGLLKSQSGIALTSLGAWATGIGAVVAILSSIRKKKKAIHEYYYPEIPKAYERIAKSVVEAVWKTRIVAESVARRVLFFKVSQSIYKHYHYIADYYATEFGEKLPAEIVEYLGTMYAGMTVAHAGMSEEIQKVYEQAGEDYVKILIDTWRKTYSDLYKEWFLTARETGKTLIEYIIDWGKANEDAFAGMLETVTTEWEETMGFGESAMAMSVLELRRGFTGLVKVFKLAREEVEAIALGLPFPAPPPAVAPAVAEAVVPEPARVPVLPAGWRAYPEYGMAVGPMGAKVPLSYFMGGSLHYRSGHNPNTTFQVTISSAFDAQRLGREIIRGMNYYKDYGNKGRIRRY